MERFCQESLMKGGKRHSYINLCNFGVTKRSFYPSTHTLWARIYAITIVISRPSAETHATDDRSHASPDEDEGRRVRKREEGLTWASVPSPPHTPHKPMSSWNEDCSVVDIPLYKAIDHFVLKLSIHRPIMLLRMVLHLDIIGHSVFYVSITMQMLTCYQMLFLLEYCCSIYLYPVC